MHFHAVASSDASVSLKLLSIPDLILEFFTDFNMYVNLVIACHVLFDWVDDVSGGP